ncbi:MAG: hypothetical protein GQ582_07500 [Methyloprofundus sp.]|nr:hypothetical protein [Methyloprofundus sp.]
MLFLTSAWSSTKAHQHAWELVKQENGIQVYTRSLAGSSYKGFKAELEIKANIEELLAFIKNASYCPSWRYKCLKMLNLSDGYIYKLSSLPWPFSNRYTVMSSDTQFDSKHNRYTVHLKNIPRQLLPEKIRQQLPDPEGSLQMRYSDGYWQFQVSPANDSVRIRYQMHGDAGAELPTELTRRGIVNAAFITLDNLKQHFMR